MDVLQLLRDGELEVRGRLTASSNAALVGIVSLPSPTGQAPAPDPLPPGLLARLLGDATPEPGHALAAVVYKPTAFEQPLWDFPDATLAQREVAAFLLSEASGWRIVPPTVLRDGPAGPGMVQLWLDEDPSVDAWELVQTADPSLRPMALFDAVVNNTDRKGGHIVPLATDDGIHLHGVDHGVCFSVDPKLRTVLWAWHGTSIAPDELATLRMLRTQLDADLGRTLGELLAPDELGATRVRLDELLATEVFPEPSTDWPAVPWPPY